MLKKDKEALHAILQNDGWSDEDMDAFIEDEEELEDLLIEDERLFAEFIEAGMEPA